jgi:pSer/pThr/pTyr-binding forkhead associated (FHA) protein
VDETPDDATAQRSPEKPDPDPTSTVMLERETLRKPLTGLTESRELVVEVVGGPMDGRRKRFTADALTIGRRETNDLSLALDSTVSGKHARIVREENQYWLEDRGSRNGTYIHEERIAARVLIGPGSIFFTGQTCLELTYY